RGGRAAGSVEIRVAAVTMIRPCGSSSSPPSPPPLVAHQTADLLMLQRSPQAANSVTIVLKATKAASHGPKMDRLDRRCEEEGTKWIPLVDSPGALDVAHSETWVY
ncbi:unnamed protein product, partial [Closterium sp. NIES-54]